MIFFSRVLFIFLAVTGATTLLIRFLDVQFGTQNYWDHHGIFFLFFITFLPRLTLLFSSVSFGGLIWWLGFFFAPRILVASMATIAYWHSNPVLVMVSWLVAISGESGEKYFVRNRVRVTRINMPFRRAPRAPTQSDALEVEYRRLD